MRNWLVLAPDPVTDVLTGGKVKQCCREAGAHVQTEVETEGMWPGARNTWSSWRLEKEGASELQKASGSVNTLNLNF